MSNVISVGQISLTDLNDGVSSISPPTSPSVGNIWIDLSTNPVMVKSWNGSVWVDVGELDPDLSETITEINRTLGNMANDNILDFKERQIIKDRLSEIIGFVIADTATTLPTVAVLDRDVRGAFYTVRKSATNAGLTSTHTAYVDVATKYEALRAYLQGLTPIKPWDLRSVNKDTNITVVKDTFRDRWLQYFIAVDTLATATALKLKENVDDIEVGGRNLLQNSTFNNDRENWSISTSYGFIENPEVDKPNSKILRLEHTASSSINSPLYNTARIYLRPKVGDSITFSLDFFCEDYSKFAPIGSIATFRRFEDKEGGSYVDSLTSGSLSNFGIDRVSGKWERGSYTYTFTSSTAVEGWYAFGVYLSNSTIGNTVKYKYREIKVELGNKATAWTSAPEDTEKTLADILGRIVDVEFSVEDDKIIAKVTGSEKYLLDRQEDINESKKYTDDNTGNLVNNPAVTGNHTGWSASGLTSVMHDFFGTSTRVLQSSVSANTQNFSNYFNVDPSKAYEISMWFKKSNEAGRVYFGLNGQDSSGATVGFEKINSSGVVSNINDTNFYFWSANLGQSPTDWVKIVGYIMPTGTDPESMENLGTSSNAIMNPNTRRVRVRFLNWENETTTRQLWVANPKVVEISSESASKSQFDIVASKMNSVEQTMTPEGISTVIEESVFYEGYLQELEKKANVEDLGDFATKEELDDLLVTTDDNLANAIAGIDFDPYVTKLDLEETSQHITSKFSATGGMNLLKNSVGFAERDTANDWEGTSWGTLVYPVSNGEINALGFGSGFYFPFMGNTRSISQKVPVIAGTPYSLSWYVNKFSNSSDNTTVGRFMVNFRESGTNKMSVYHDTITDGFEHHTMTYVPETNELEVRFYAYSSAEATITGIMLNIGDVPLQWSLATGELYNTNVRADIKGVRVSQLNSDGREVGYTHMTPDEFAGYYDSNEDGSFEKVFYIREDETVSKKFRAQDEITMGTIKIVNIKSEARKGWAFVPTAE